MSLRRDPRTRGAAGSGPTLRTRVLLAFSMLILALAAVASVVAFNAVRSSYLGGEQNRLLRLLAVHGASFQQTIQTMERGAQFLAATPQVQAVIDARTPQALAAAHESLARLMRAYGELHPEALQLRLIGLAGGGREVVRLNREEGEIVTVAQADLQAKGAQPYVKAGAGLPRGGVHLSPITLNREFGRIQVPHVPVIRFVAPVFSAADGRRYGMIVINIDARVFLHGLKSGLPSATRVIVANESGDLLMYPDKRYDFGFDLGHPYRLSGVLRGYDPARAAQPIDGADLNGNDLQRVSSESLGALYVVGGRLPFDAAHSSRYLTLLLARPAGMIETAIWREFAPYELAIVGLALMLGLAAALSTLRAFTPLQRLAEALREVGHGRYDTPLPEAASGEMASFVSAVDVMRRDIRQREQDNRDLAERLSVSEAFSSGVIDAMPDSLLVVDAAGRVVRVNANASRMFGYPQAGFANLTLEDFVPNDVRSRHVELRTGFMATLREQRLATFPNLRARRADGSLFPANVSVALMQQDDEEYLIIAVSDLTARKAMEDELRRGEERFRLMTENVRDYSIILLDPEGRVMTWNAGAERLHGYPAAEMLGESFAKLYSPEEIAEDVPGKLLARARTQGIARLEGWRHRKGGERFFAQVVITPTYDGTGELLGFVKIDHDQSERLSAEMAKAASESKSQFLANMSHEIRTPLNGVVGLTQLLLDTPLDKRQSDYMHKLNDAACSLLKILNDILDYSKIEAGRLELERASFYLDDTIDTVTTLYSFRAEEKGVELLLDIEPDLPQCLLGDKLRLSQVLNNLVGNAVKFTDQGEVRISVGGQRLDGHRVRLDFAVRDTGIGMNSEQVAELFQAFHQADSSITRRFGGTGLGLIISQRLVEAMGGEIRVTSTLGQGSTFQFQVVLDYEPSGGESRREPGQLTPMRVLVVDDNPAMLDILEGLLKVWGMEVVKATDAYAGLGLARESAAAGRPIGLYLIDWKMPRMDGLAMSEQLQWMSERGEVNEAPLVVMVTAYGHEQVKQAANEVTLQGVLDKPVTASRLFDLLISVQHGPDAHGPELSESRSVQLRGRTESIRGAHVLLVEDNPTNQLVARSFLEKLELMVDIAGNGREAVEMAQAHTYDAILMDLQMPLMDGFEATRRIRAQPDGATVPIIAMTAAALVSDREATEAAGMNAHVAKPIELDKLVETLLAWVKPRPPAERGRFGSTAVAGDEPLTLPGLDLDQAAARLGGDRQLLRNVLESFQRDFSDATARLNELLERGELGDAARLVHTIKGLAPNLGAPALGAAAAEYEAALKAGNADATLREAFTQALETALAALAGLTPASAKAIAGGPSAHATAEDLETLRELSALLEQSVIVSQLQKDRVTAVLRDRVDAVQRDALFAAIGHLDYAEAARVLDGIMQALGDARQE